MRLLRLSQEACVCNEYQRAHYISKISGLLLDRIDLQIEVLPVGFEQMGSQRDFETNLLVAVDTSGSVGSEELGRYFRIITTFFKYGIQHVDVIMFDVNIQGKVMALDKFDCDKSQFSVSGRGGTNFQAPIDYVAENGSYDGLIIITDGWAKAPVIPPHLRTKLLWIIDNEKAYKQQYAALRKSGRVCLMQL